MQDELSVGAQLPEKPVIGTGNPLPAKALQVGAELLEALEPCPFCGAKPSVGRYVTESLFSHDDVEFLDISCTECDGAHMCGEQHSEIIAAWNTRADRPAVAVPVGGGVSPSSIESAAIPKEARPADAEPPCPHCGSTLHGVN